MNLEQIDTSTMAGKAEVMRLAAEGRKVAQRTFHNEAWIEQRSPAWAWPTVDYAIIAEPVVPDEVWIIHTPNYRPHGEEEAKRIAANHGGEAVCYRRVDLAGKVP